MEFETAGGRAEKAAHATAGESERLRGSRGSGSSLCTSTNSYNSSGCVVGVASRARQSTKCWGSTWTKSPVTVLSCLSTASGTRERVPGSPHASTRWWSESRGGQAPKTPLRDGSESLLLGGLCRLRATAPATRNSHVRVWGPRAHTQQNTNTRSVRHPSLLLPHTHTTTTTTWQQRVGVVTPSLHLEVPDTRFVSPGRGLGIRQSMGWTKVSETARSGIWVLKGNARACTENLDHLRVEWRNQGSYETAPGYARTRLSVSIQVWTWKQLLSDHKQLTTSGMGLLVCGCRVAPLLSPWCARGNVPTGVNLNQYAGITHSLAQR